MKETRRFSKCARITALLLSNDVGQACTPRLRRLLASSFSSSLSAEGSAFTLRQRPILSKMLTLSPKTSRGAFYSASSSASSATWSSS